MVALGVGAVLSIILRALLVIGLVLAGAYALTTYVALPGWADTLIWIGAGGYSLLCAVVSVISIIALATAGGMMQRKQRFR